MPDATAPVAALPAPAPTVIDATGLVLGRAASLIARRLLAGERIVVVHAEQAVVTGSRSSVLAEFTARRARGSVRSGPHYPRYADRIFRRTVRGMLPHLKTRGKEALGRLEVHLGVPPEYQGVSAGTLEAARARPTLRPPLTLAEITALLGARW
ncbi:MAG: 50S ribosomal protein L13 [Thermoplasmata archaeon]